MLLNDANALYVLNVLVKSRVYGHVLSSHSKPLLVLLLIFDANHEGDACWILFHHLKHEPDSQVNSFNHQRLVPLLVIINDLFELSLDFVTLILVAHERPLLVRSYFL